MRIRNVMDQIACLASLVAHSTLERCCTCLLAVMIHTVKVHNHASIHAENAATAGMVKHEMAVQRRDMQALAFITRA